MDSGDEPDGCRMEVWSKLSKICCRGIRKADRERGSAAKFGLGVANRASGRATVPGRRPRSGVLAQCGALADMTSLWDEFRLTRPGYFWRIWEGSKPQFCGQNMEAETDPESRAQARLEVQAESLKETQPDADRADADPDREGSNHPPPVPDDVAAPDGPHGKYDTYQEP
jgi:hypothetical protein